MIQGGIKSGQRFGETGSTGAIERMRARGCDLERFIFLSSSMVYGNFKTETVDEDHPLDPIGIYGALKLSGEKIVIAYNQVFGLPYTIIRPSALYGARCVSRRVGQVYIETAVRGGKLRVDGDGAERIDFTYIDDLVDGICRTITTPEAKNQTFNLTNGGARSINRGYQGCMRGFRRSHLSAGSVVDAGIGTAACDRRGSAPPCTTPDLASITTAAA